MMFPGNILYQMMPINHIEAAETNERQPSLNDTQVWCHKHQINDGKYLCKADKQDACSWKCVDWRMTNIANLMARKKENYEGETSGSQTTFSGWVAQQQDVCAMWVPLLLEAQMKSNAHGASILCLASRVSVRGIWKRVICYGR